MDVGGQKGPDGWNWTDGWQWTLDEIGTDVGRNSETKQRNETMEQNNETNENGLRL